MKLNINYKGILPGLLSILLLTLILFGIMPGFFVYGISVIFAYGSARWGEKKVSMLNLAIFLLLSTLLYGFSLGLIEIYLLALYGILLGQFFYHQAKPEAIFIPSTIFLYGTMLLMILLQRKYLGVDVLAAMETMYLEQLSSAFQDAQALAQLKLILQDYGITLLFLVAVLLNLLVCWTLQGVLQIKKIPASFVLEHFRLREVRFLPLVGLFLLGYFGATLLDLKVEIVLYSLLIFLLCLYFVQGISLLVYSLKRRGRGGILLGLVVALGMFLPFAQLGIILFGLLDQFRDFRKLEHLS